MVTNSEFRNEIIKEKFQWLSDINDSSYKKLSKADLSIRECKTSDKKGLRYNVTFRNGKSEIFGEFVDFAFLKNRLYMRPSTQRSRGYKLYCFDGGKANPFAQITKNTTTCEFSDFIGDYDIKHDEFLDLYYIEKEAQA